MHLGSAMIRVCFHDGCREPLNDSLHCSKGHDGQDGGWLDLSGSDVVAIVTPEENEVSAVDWAPAWDDSEAPDISGRDVAGQAPRRVASNGRVLGARSYSRNPPETLIQEFSLLVRSGKKTVIGVA